MRSSKQAKKSKKLLMADLPGVVHYAKERKRPFYWPHELQEVMEQRDRVIRKPCIVKFNSMFDLLPYTVHG